MYGWLWDEQEGFLILLELYAVYFAFQYAAILDPAAGFQARRLLVCVLQLRIVTSILKSPIFQLLILYLIPFFTVRGLVVCP